jgi:hypothetical protein
VEAALKKTPFRTCLLILLASALAVVCLIVVIQILPFGRNHTNPPVSAEPLNFSEWNRPQEGGEDAAEVVAEGEMPLGQYLLIHPEARLSAQEKAELIAGLQATLGGEGRLEGNQDDD